MINISHETKNQLLYSQVNTKYIYADYTGTGQACPVIDTYIMKNIIPFYSNVHSNSKGAKKMTDLYRFQTAEAAFQAFKFFTKDSTVFRKLVDSQTGDDAIQIKNPAQGKEDWTFVGRDPQGTSKTSTHGNWFAMYEVLLSKFTLHTNLNAELLKTGDRFLLEHNNAIGRDTIWSNNGDGTGKNWLGLQLMILRDYLRGTSTKSNSWTQQLLTRGVLIPTNPTYSKNVCPYMFRDSSNWQKLVSDATNALVKEYPSCLAKHVQGKRSRQGSRQGSKQGSRQGKYVSTYSASYGSKNRYYIRYIKMCSMYGKTTGLFYKRGK